MRDRRLVTSTLLTLVCAVSAFAAGVEIAPQHVDSPGFPIGRALQVSNGRTTLSLWTVDEYGAGQHVYGTVADASGHPRFAAKTILTYIDRADFAAAPSGSGYLVARRVASGYEVRTLAEDGTVGASAQATVLPSDAVFARTPFDVAPELTLMAARQIAPRIASDGANALALWTDRSGKAQSVMARRLNARGEPLASPVTLGISSSVIGDEQLTYGGGQYLAVWQDGGRIVAARIDASGGVIDANPIAVRTITGASRLGAASDGHDFFVVWSERTAVFGAIVTSGGQVLPPRLLVTVSTQAIATEPVVTFDGTNYVAAYEVTEVPRVCGNPCRALTRIESVRIGHDGTTIDGSPVPVASDVAQIGRISIAGGGGNSLLAYTDGTNVFTTILRDGPTFIAATPSVVFSWTDAVAPSVIWTGSGYLLALRFTSNFYDPDGGSEWYVGAMRVAADGTRGDMTAIATGASADLALESAGVAALPGSAVFAVSEARNAGEAPRAVAYTLTELRPFTAPPVITPVPTPTPQPTPTPTPEPTPQPQPTPPPQPQPTPRAPSRPHAAPHQ